MVLFSGYVEIENFYNALGLGKTIKLFLQEHIQYINYKSLLKNIDDHKIIILPQ